MSSVDPPLPAHKRRPAPALFWVAVACAGLLAVGGLGPWRTLVVVRQTGPQVGDGWAVVALGLLGLVMLAASRRALTERPPLVVGAVAAGVALLVTGSALAEGIAGRKVLPLGGLVEPAWGLYLAVISAAGLLVSTVVLAVRAGRA